MKGKKNCLISYQNHKHLLGNNSYEEDKRQATDGEKVFAKYTPDRGPVFRIALKTQK